MGRAHDKSRVVYAPQCPEQDLRRLYQRTRTAGTQLSVLGAGGHCVVSAVFLLWHGGKPSRQWRQLVDPAHGVHHPRSESMGFRTEGMERSKPENKNDDPDGHPVHPGGGGTRRLREFIEIEKYKHMSVITTKFKHVSYLWDEKKAAEMAGDEVALLIYSSNLLGADLRLTNYGGGNTSC